MLKDVLKTLKDDPSSWKRILKFEHEPLFGLDIGSSSVKLLQLKKNGSGYSVAAVALADVVTDGVLDSEAVEANTVNAICAALQLTGIESRSAICGISGPEVAVRDFKFPALAPEELDSAVALEAGQACPFHISESVIDHQILSSTPESISGVLVAATQKLVNDKVRFASGASVKSVLMDVDGLALLNCFIETQSRMVGQTVAILNVGSSCATLAILGDDNSVFVRDILHAGDTIIAEIANAKNISREQVRRILYADGINSAQLDAQVIEKACQKLTGDIADTLRFYTAQQKTAFIDKMHICGGFALVKGFAEFLSSQLHARVILWNPFDKISCPAVQYKDVVTKYGPSLAVAAGLAMRSI